MAEQQLTADLPLPSLGWYHLLMVSLGIMAALLFGAMAVLVCADVFLRNLGGSTIQWAVEVTEYMTMAATFLAAPWLLYTNSHIRIDLLLRAAPAWLGKALSIGTDAIGLLICCLLAWKCISVTADTAEQGGMVFKVLIFPEWWLSLPISFSFLALSLEFTRRIWRGLRLPVEQ